MSNGISWVKWAGATLRIALMMSRNGCTSMPLQGMRLMARVSLLPLLGMLCCRVHTVEAIMPLDLQQMVFAICLAFTMVSPTATTFLESSQQQDCLLKLQWKPQIFELWAVFVMILLTSCAKLCRTTLLKSTNHLQMFVRMA